MKKVLTTLLFAGFIALVSCGPSAEEKQASEKAMQDSIAAAEQASGAMNEQAGMSSDSSNMMMSDSSKMMMSDSAK